MMVDSLGTESLVGLLAHSVVSLFKSKHTIVKHESS